MDAKLLRLGRHRVLLSKPRSQVLGLLIADVLITLLVARVTRASVWFIRARTPSPLMEILCDEVPVRARGWRVEVASRLWPLIVLPQHLHGLWARTRNAGASWVEALAARAGHRLDLNRRSEWNGRVRGTRAVRRRPTNGSDVASGRIERHSVTERRTRGDVHRGYDIRKLAAEPLHVRFDPGTETRARTLASTVGLTDRTPMVTLHVREDVSKPSVGAAERDRDSVRSARIDTYGPAIDHLVGRGFTVVRIGDPSMTPLVRPGVVDLASHPDHETLLDVWCVAHSRFFLACDSGPYLLSWLFGVPCLAVNIVNVLGVFPLRTRDRYLVKRIQEVETGRVLSLDEMLAPDVVHGLRKRIHKERTMRYVDNSAGELLEAVEEMCDGLDRDCEPSAAQRHYRDLLLRARAHDRARQKLLDKTGLAEVHLGDGQIVHRFAVRHMSPATAPGCRRA